MEVIMAKTAGFCFGVKKAVEKVYEQAEKENVYTFGPIIHNEEVVRDLEQKGVRVISSEEELESITQGTIIIRSHGVSKKIYDKIKSLNVEMIDATCPFVLKIHRIVEKESKDGRKIIIIGNDGHPEVEGIKGWSVTPVTVIDSVEQALKFDENAGSKICIISQTTFNYKKFQELVEIITKKRYDILIRNTICNATEERQTEAREIAERANVMIVIGSKSSSNTKKLYEICKNECKDTYYIQKLSDLDLYKFDSVGCIGITAGASTPNKIIEEVHTNVRIKF